MLVILSQTVYNKEKRTRKRNCDTFSAKFDILKNRNRKKKTKPWSWSAQKSVLITTGKRMNAMI